MRFCAHYVWRNSKMLGSFEEALKWCSMIGKQTEGKTKGDVYITAHGPNGRISLDGIPTIGTPIWRGTPEDADKLLSLKH
jgi:hypothetical protein